MHKKLSFQKNKSLLDKIEEVFSGLDRALNSKEIISLESSKRVYKCTRSIKHICKEVKRDEVPIVGIITTYCTNIRSYYERANMRPVDSFYLLEAFNALILTLVIKQENANAIAITSNQYTLIENTISIFDDSSKWHQSSTCNLYIQHSKSILPKISVQKTPPDSQAMLEQVASTIEFTSDIASHVADKNIVSLSLDAVRIAQNLINFMNNIHFDFNKRTHSFMFNCMILTDSFLDDTKHGDIRDESKNKLISLAEKVIGISDTQKKQLISERSDTHESDYQRINYRNKSKKNIIQTLLFSLGKIFLNLTSSSEQNFVYNILINPLLDNSHPETQFIVLRKLLKSSNYEIYEDVCKKLNHLASNKQLETTLKERIELNQSEMRFLAGGSDWHACVISKLNPQEASDQSSIPKTTDKMFMKDKFDRTPLILALQILNTLPKNSLKAESLRQLIDIFISHHCTTGLLTESQKKQTCFDLFAQGNHIDYIRKTLFLFDNQARIFNHVDANGNYLFHHFIDGIIDRQNLVSLQDFVALYKQCSETEGLEPPLAPITDYFSNSDFRGNTILHLLAKRFSELIIKEPLLTPERVSIMASDIVTLFDFLLNTLDVQITQNNNYKYFFNEFYNQGSLSSSISESFEQIQNYTLAKVKTKSDNYLLACLHATSNISDFESSISELSLTEDKSSIKRLILNIASSVPSHLKLLDNYSYPLNEFNDELVQASLENGTFQNVVNYIKGPSQDQPYLIDWSQLGVYSDVSTTISILEKCNNKFKYLNTIFTTDQNNLFFEKATLLDSLVKLFDQEANIALAELLLLSVKLDTEEKFSIFLSLNANPNLKLKNSEQTCLSFICNLEDEEKSIKFMNLLFKHCKTPLMMSPLTEQATIDPNSPLSKIFERLNASLLNMIIERSFLSVTEKTPTCWQRVSCTPTHNLIGAKVGMSITDVARCIDTFLLRNTFLTTEQRISLLTPELDTRKNQDKLDLVKDMVEELDKQGKEKNEKRKCFERHLIKGTFLFHKNRHNLGKMIIQLMSLYKQWEKEANIEVTSKIRRG